MNLSEKEQIKSYMRQVNRTWYTCTLCLNYNLLTVYRGEGLDFERDGIDKDDLNDDYQYWEIDFEQLENLLDNARDLNFMLMEDLK